VRENKNVERFLVKPPAHDRNQGNAEEIERYHQAGIAGAERIGQAVVRRHSGDAETRQRRQLVQAELAREQGIGAHEPERQLDDVHPEHDREGALGRGQFLGGDVLDRVAERCRQDDQSSRMKRLDAGAQDHEYAEQAEHDRADAARRHAFRKEQRRHQHGPCRHGEFEREDGAQRQQQEACRPQILGAEVDAVAQDMERQPPAVERVPQLGTDRQQGPDDQQSDGGPRRQDLHDAERRGQFPDRYRHRRERQQGADHPQDDASDGRDDHVGCVRAVRLQANGPGGEGDR
jgi:hypothetical protein